MHVLHVTAHLGGGVGKAHAALRAAMADSVRQTYLLLEAPRDRRYADEIAALGGEILVAESLADVAARARDADIVQFEFWNHPKLFECLARTDFPPHRSVFWSHVSGLFRPVIRPGFLTAPDRFVFTTPASLVLGESLPAAEHARLSAIGSGFGFATSTSVATAPCQSLPPAATPSVLPDISPFVGEMPGRAEGAIDPLHAAGLDERHHPIAYLGTVDFVKMHPGFFDAIDALATETAVAVWGGLDPAGEVAARARAMRHPHRIRFMGQTPDPQAALEPSRIFFYPLQPDHYGTAENALIEAMSLGLVPVVLANPAECAIVEDGVTGFVAASIAECGAILDRLLADPGKCARLGANARHVAMEKHTPGASAEAFVALWSDLVRLPKRQPDYASLTGVTPLDWYLATQSAAGEEVVVATMSDTQSKGTLAHFRAAFPDDPCWTGL